MVPASPLRCIPLTACYKMGAKEPTSKGDPPSGNESPAEDGHGQAEGSTTPQDSGGHLGSTTNHVFSDPSVADYWRLKYEKAGYENRHRFDPEYQWTAKEEKKLVRKVREALLFQKEALVLTSLFSSD